MSSFKNKEGARFCYMFLKKGLRIDYNVSFVGVMQRKKNTYFNA